MPGDAVSELLRGLTPAQAEAVSTEAAPLCVLAGPGSGKTRVVTRRIAHRVATGRAEARHVLALTFTRKAAGELRSRLGALGVQGPVMAGTFHGVAYASLRSWWADTGRSAPTLLDRKAGLLARLLRADPGLGHVSPLDVATEIEWSKARAIGPAGYPAAALAARRRPPLEAGAFADLFRRYEDEKRRRGLVDFDDLLLRCARAIETEPELAARERWRFRHLFVDELQDVNPLQARLLEAWRGGRDDLCVVGDPDQAVYGWNGADPGYLLAFQRRHPEGRVLALDDNFRSTPQVLAAADAVLGGREGGRGPLRAARADGALPTVRRFDDEVAEARGIAAALRRRGRDGLRWSAMAVLVRTHAQAVVLEEALVAAGVPHRVRAARPFLRQPAVTAVLDGLRRRPGPLAPHLTDLAVAVVDAGGSDHDPGAEDGEGPLLAELLRLGREYEALDPSAGTGGFLGWLAATLGADGSSGGGDAVEIATFHAAKGLEWPVVFVAGIEQGLVPIGHARSDAEVAEERRLLYVALTRAEEELHCSWAGTRSFGDGGRPAAREPSPWLLDVEVAVGAMAEVGPGGDWRAHLAEGRRRLRLARASEAPGAGGARRVGAAADPVVLGVLERWRSAAARAAGVPRHVILHDVTLAAVAEAQPSDLDGLLALPGLGPVKVDRYGDDLLALLAEHPAS